MTSGVIPQVGFVGRSGSGKTTLIERLVPELLARGLRIAVVKHSHHTVEMDRPGKDSWRFREAGAEHVFLLTPERAYLQTTPLNEASNLDTFVQDVDLVIHEGGRSSEHPKVLVGEGICEALDRGTRGVALAVVGDHTSSGLPVFDRDDVAGVAAFLAGFVESAVGEASFSRLLSQSVAAHGHMCPGQVLGVRMTVRALQELGLSVPPPAKRLAVFVETDRCAIDAIASVSGCSVGKRSLKLIDHGKMAATFLDLATGAAVRVVVRDDSREHVPAYASPDMHSHEAQSLAYRLMPEQELLAVQRVSVSPMAFDPAGSRPGRAPCDDCGEHVTEGREERQGGKLLCKQCAGDSYYTLETGQASWPESSSASTLIS
jgi:formylmethanofuran dehydrogenase subunit E